MAKLQEEQLIVDVKLLAFRFELPPGFVELMVGIFVLSLRLRVATLVDFMQMLFLGLIDCRERLYVLYRPTLKFFPQGLYCALSE
jgi:hypothetical protein